MRRIASEANVEHDTLAIAGGSGRLEVVGRRQDEHDAADAEGENPAEHDEGADRVNPGIIGHPRSVESRWRVGCAKRDTRPRPSQGWVLRLIIRSPEGAVAMRVGLPTRAPAERRLCIERHRASVRGALLLTSVEISDWIRASIIAARRRARERLFGGVARDRPPNTGRARNIEGSARPYQPLYDYVRGRYADQVVLRFSEVEDVLGFPLPPAARVAQSWWSGDEVFEGAQVPGDRSVTVNLATQVVVYQRVPAGGSPNR